MAETKSTPPQMSREAKTPTMRRKALARGHHAPLEGKNLVALGSPKEAELPKRRVATKTAENRPEREPKVAHVSCHVLTKRCRTGAVELVERRRQHLAGLCPPMTRNYRDLTAKISNKRGSNGEGRRGNRTGEGEEKERKKGGGGKSMVERETRVWEEKSSREKAEPLSLEHTRKVHNQLHLYHLPHYIWQ